MITINSEDGNRFTFKEEKLIAFEVSVDEDYIDNKIRKKVRKYFLVLWIEGLYGFIETTLPDDIKEREKIIKKLEKVIGGESDDKKRKRNIEKS